MISGYTRKPSKFDWCGTHVWLMKLTKADRDSAFSEGAEAPLVDVLRRCVTDEAGNPLFANTADAVAYFDANVAEDDVVALAKLAMKHSGYDLDNVEVQKKS